MPKVVNNAETMMEVQYTRYDDEVSFGLRSVATVLCKVVPNEEGIRQEFWLHKVPFAEVEG